MEKSEKKGFNFKEFWNGVKKDKKKMFFALLIPSLLVLIVVVSFFTRAQYDQELQEEKEEVNTISAVDVPVIDSMEFARMKKQSKTELYRSDFFNIENEQSRIAEEERKAKEFNRFVSNSSTQSTPVTQAFEYKQDKEVRQAYVYKSPYTSSSNTKKMNGEQVVSANTNNDYKTQVEEPQTQETVVERKRRTPSDNYGNMTKKKVVSKKLYLAVIANENKLIKSNYPVKIRIGEDINIDGLTLSRNSIVTGVAQQQNDRMNIKVSSVKIGKEIKQVEWQIYSEDGIEGIAIPPSLVSKIGTDASQEAIEKSNSSIETNIPLLGGLKMNLKKKAQEVEFVLTSGHKIYIKEIEK